MVVLTKKFEVLESLLFTSFLKKLSCSAVREEFLPLAAILDYEFKLDSS